MHVEGYSLGIFDFSYNMFVIKWFTPYSVMCFLFYDMFDLYILYIYIYIYLYIICVCNNICVHVPSILSIFKSSF